MFPGVKTLLALIFTLPMAALAIVNGRAVDGTEPFAKSIAGLARATADGGYHIFCSASLVRADALVTAAHCVAGLADDEEIFAVFGLNEDELEARPIAKFFVHEEYGRSERKKNIYDIALARFKGRAPAGFAPLPLLAGDSALGAGMRVTLVGYGISSLNPGMGSGILRWTTAPILSGWETELRTDERLSGTCNMDSGGPGLIELGGRHYLWGLTSGGSPDCVGTGIYTKITAYADWVTATLAAP